MIEIIAEMGVNHNGSRDTAFALVDAAIGAGCMIVKTQLWNTERVYPRERWDEMKRLELSQMDIAHLKHYCDMHGVELIVTPDEIEDAQFLKEIGVKRIKTSSQDITNIPFLRGVAALGLPMIVSTGACDWFEMMIAMREIRGVSGEWPSILHCVSCYPAPLAEMNLRVIPFLWRTFGRNVGLSDHTIGSDAAIMALALGARIFEKHLTLDRNQDGPDHKASAMPDELWYYVQILKQCEAALGDGEKRVMSCEVSNRAQFDKFIEFRKGGVNAK